MKKIIYAILGIFLMVACTDDHQKDIPTLPKEETNGKVTVKFSVQVPEANAIGSRSFDEPAINSLHLVVFDANGYLSEVEEAERESTGLGTADAPIEFTVDLNQTPSKRIIHFLANKTIDASQFGTESDLIGALYTQGTDDAYWQRVELPDGISYTWTDTNNDGKLNDKEPVLFNSIGDKLTGVPLIRNFAKITVEVGNDLFTPGNAGFTLQGFTVVNVPDRGSVAPFNTNGGGFAQYVDADKTPYGYNDLTGTIGYTGFVPTDAIINENVGTILDKDAEFFMYERNGQAKNVNRTFVIVKGQFGTDAPSYYKIDLTYTNTDKTTGYYEILRNFHYNIVIHQVEASGEATAGDAADMKGAHNNLSASVETQSLLNISDGESRLFVNYTEYIFVASRDTMELKYRYVPDISKPDTEDNGVATYSWDKENEAVASITAAANDDGQGWRTLTVIAAEMDANDVKRQTLTLVAGNLSRTVTFILRSKFNFSNEKATSPSPANTLKGTFTYSFTIPQNIPESLFPLTFIVQADPENIYPNADENSLPVQVLDGEQTFGYEREVTYEEYQQTGGIINCYFRVNTTSYTNTQITVSNKYFNACTPVALNNNNTTYAFSNMVVNGGEAVPYGAGRSVTFTFDMPYVAAGGTDVTITANKMSAMSKATTFTYKATATGTQTVTFTTAEFASADRIKLEADGYITGIKAYDNVLKIRAASVTGTTTPALGKDSAIRVYASESDAKVYGDNHLAEVPRSTLTGSQTDIALTGLTAESVLYFAYEGSTHIYVGQATAGDLAATTPTADIVFNSSYEKPLEWSAELTGEQYYGQDHKVTLSFNVNKTGKYIVVITEGNKGKTQEITVTESNISNTQTVTYTPLEKNIAITATITYQNTESMYHGKELDVESDERNMLPIKAASVKYGSMSWDVGNGNITISGTYTDTNGQTQTISVTTTGNGLINGIDILCPNLDMTQIGSVNVTISYSYFSTSTTLQNLYNGTPAIRLTYNY